MGFGPRSTHPLRLSFAAPARLLVDFAQRLLAESFAKMDCRVFRREDGAFRAFRPAMTREWINRKSYDESEFVRVGAAEQ
jgi:hypothetical protein